MPTSCEGALILAMSDTLVFLKGQLEADILSMQNQIYAKKELIEKLDSRIVHLCNAHLVLHHRPDRGIMEFGKEATDRLTDENREAVDHLSTKGKPV